MISAKKPKMCLNKFLTSMIQISYVTINFMKQLQTYMQHIYPHNLFKMLWFPKHKDDLCYHAKNSGPQKQSLKQFTIKNCTNY